MRGLSLRDLMSSPIADEDEDREHDRRGVDAGDDELKQDDGASPPASSTATMSKASIGFLLGADVEASDDDTESDPNVADIRQSPAVVPQPWSRSPDHRHRESPPWGFGPGAGDRVSLISAAARALSAVSMSPLASSAMGEGEEGDEEDTAATAVDGGDGLPKRRKKRKARICKEPGCEKYVVDHGLCIRHGGGKRCNVEGCNCRAQNRGLCWKHGGYTICKVDGCTKRAKSRGICWSHGGGTRCKFDGCTKIAVSQGRCWAHGGGKRCVMDGCRRPASERTDNFCADHFGCRPGGSHEVASE